MTEIKDWVFTGLATLITGVGSWLFKRLIVRIDEHEAKIQILESELKLNSQRDEQMTKEIGETNKTVKETQAILRGFLEKYAFIMEKQYKKEIEK